MLRDRTEVGLTVGLVVLLVAGFFMVDWMRFIGLQSLSRGLVALGLLVLWRTGLVSFGQALFFGTGAYMAVLLVSFAGIRDAFVVLLAASVASALLAFVIGFLLRKYRDIFFAMLNMAFSMILYGVLVKSESLGSTDGFGVAHVSFVGFEPSGDSYQLTLYFVAVVICFIAAIATNRYLGSTLGSLTSAIRENEIRVEYLGYSAEHAIHIKYVIAGLLAGLGGCLMALTVGQVDPDSMAYWTVSGEFVFITILAGTGNVAAPFIGALVFELIRTYAFEHAPHIWQLILGGTLLVIILFLPNGLWSLASRFHKSAEG